MVTDGRSGLFPGDAYTTLLTRQVAEDEKAKGVIILAIGVGDGIDVHELKAMASEPKDSHWTRLGGFGSLLKLSRAISGLCVPEIPGGSTRKWGLCLSPIGGAGFEAPLLLPYRVSCRHNVGCYTCHRGMIWGRDVDIIVTELFWSGCGGSLRG